MSSPTRVLVGYNNINYGLAPYGDVLVGASVTATSVPEPGTLTLLALGLLALGVTRRRWPMNASIG